MSESARTQVFNLLAANSLFMAVIYGVIRFNIHGVALEGLMFIKVVVVGLHERDAPVLMLYSV